MDRSSSGSKPLAKKLALKAGQRFLLLGAPPGYKDALGPLPQGVTLATKAGGKADAVQVFATTKKEMREALAEAKAALNPGGMIWLTYPKGTSKIESDINRDSIREYTLSVGLQTVALVAVDDDWSAIRCKAV
jgi:Protein of unknown function (DUF3052)